TSTNSSEARRGECTPRAVSSARLSRLRGFGDQGGGAMVRSYAAARIHISSPARDVDDRLWGGDRRRWCPVHPSPAPSPHAPPRRLCAFQNRQWLPSAQDHCRRGGFERAGSGQVGQLLEALEALAVIVGVGGDRLDALTHGHRVRG